MKNILLLFLSLIILGCSTNEKSANTKNKDVIIQNKSNKSIQKPEWFFCDNDGCYEKVDDELSIISELPVQYSPFVRFADEIDPSLKIKSENVFFIGIKKQNDDVWAFMERTIIGNEYWVWRYNPKENSKKILFSHSDTPNRDHAFKPIAWYGDELILEEFILDHAEKHIGLWAYNHTNKTFSKLNLDSNYLSTPILSPDYNYLLYSATHDIDSQNILHTVPDQLILFDLKNRKETILVENSTIGLFGWVQKKKRNNVDKENRITGFKLPWVSGIDRCVTRDGNAPPPPPIGSSTTCADLGNHGYIAWDFDTSNTLDEEITAVYEGVVTTVNYATGDGGYSPNGYGNWVIITHPNNYRTLYGHLSSVNVSVGDNVDQGCVLGMDGTTGVSSGDHLHLEYEYPGGSGNLYTTFDECNCVPHGGYSYTSSNTLNDCGNSYGLDCSSAIPLDCGVIYSGSSSTANSNVASYACGNWTETGPERVHSITPSTDGILTAIVSNFSGDLDVFILGSCDPTDCLGTIGSSFAIYTNVQAGQTYYIVVDSDDGSGSSYDLVVNCSDIDSEDIFLSDERIATSTIVNDGENLVAVVDQNYVGTSTTTSIVYLYYYLSTDCVLDDSDVLLSDEDYSELSVNDPFETEGQVLTIPVGTTPGEYYILFEGDATDVISESDENNNTTCTPITVTSSSGVEDMTFKQKIKIFPNPVDDYLNFECNDSAIIQQIILFNEVGQKLKTIENPSDKIDLSGLSSGVYFMRFIDVENNEVVFKILRN